MYFYDTDTVIIIVINGEYAIVLYQVALRTVSIHSIL